MSEMGFYGDLEKNEGFVTGDSNQYAIPMDKMPPSTIPISSEWSCQLFGGGKEGIVWRPQKGKEPNFFWRWMQYIIFGNKWVKDVTFTVSNRG